MVLFAPCLAANRRIEHAFSKNRDKAGNVDISVRLSPICYPMHDHTEPSQSAQGGNYGLGMMSGLHFIGDRNTPEESQTSQTQ